MIRRLYLNPSLLVLRTSAQLVTWLPGWSDYSQVGSADLEIFQRAQTGDQILDSEAGDWIEREVLAPEPWPNVWTPDLEDEDTSGPARPNISSPPKTAVALSRSFACGPCIDGFTASIPGTRESELEHDFVRYTQDRWEGSKALLSTYSSGRLIITDPNAACDVDPSRVLPNGGHQLGEWELHSALNETKRPLHIRKFDLPVLSQSPELGMY